MSHLCSDYFNLIDDFIAALGNASVSFVIEREIWYLFEIVENIVAIK